MNHDRGNQIVTDFIHMLSKLPEINVTKRRDISPNVYEIDGAFNSLLYVKARSEEPLRWGVRKTIVERLRRQAKPWDVLLLYDLPCTGFLFFSKVVLHYIDNSIWPYAKDGDYKPSDTEKYSSKSVTVRSIDELLHKISAT